MLTKKQIEKVIWNNQIQKFPRSYALTTFWRSPVREKTTKRENIFCEISESLAFNPKEIVSGKWFTSTNDILEAIKVTFRPLVKKFGHVNTTTFRKKVIFWACHNSCCNLLGNEIWKPETSCTFDPQLWHFEELFSIQSVMVSNTFKKLRRGGLGKSKKIRLISLDRKIYRRYSVFCGHKSSMTLTI